MTDSSPPGSGERAAPTVAVVIPTRDRVARLARLLEAIAAQRFPLDGVEVVVVDDGSRAGARDVVERHAARLPVPPRVIDGGGRGPATARNIGWRATAAPLVAFTDDDCEPERDWLAAGAAAAAAAPGAIIQGRTRPNPREASNWAPLARTKSIDSLGPWFQTCNIFYPRELLERLGGFDERFSRPCVSGATAGRTERGDAAAAAALVAAGEDVDLAWRALEQGAEIRFEPGALVNHAVERLTPIEFLRSAARDPDEAIVFKRHPLLRREVRRLGLFKSDHHALLALAAVSLLAGQRRPTWATLAIPYLILVLARCRAGRGHPGWAPWLVAHDAIELVQAARGALRHRTPIV